VIHLFGPSGGGVRRPVRANMTATEFDDYLLTAVTD
jgi:hypothetical protein